MDVLPEIDGEGEMTTLAPTTAYWKNKAAKLEQQRDELLEALKDIARGPLQEPQPFEQYAVIVAQSAIAKVEEK